MSYSYDVMSRVFERRIRPLLVAADQEELAIRFSELIDAMHSANHRVPSADGIFNGDGINKDNGVTRAARDLDDYDKARTPA